MRDKPTVFVLEPNNRTFDPDNFTISQSMIKEWVDYAKKDRLCGIQFQALLEGRISQEVSDVMQLGNYFEYVATGALPKSGVIPQAELYQKSGNGYSKGDTKWDYLHADDQAAIFKETLKEMGLVIHSFGVREMRDEMEGTMDLICQITQPEKVLHLFDRDEIAAGIPDKIHFDLKFSGKIDDKWEGWDADFLDERDEVAIQAHQYAAISRLPFAFWIFDSKKRGNKMIRVHFAPDALDDWATMAQKTRRRILVDYRTGGFVPRPDGKRCAVCPLAPECKHFTIVPKAEHVYFTTPQI